MQKQAMLVLVLLSLLLPPKNPVFAEESSAAPQTLRYKLVKAARAFLNLPYRWGGMSEQRGADCSGLVKMIFAKLHINLPRTSREQIQSGKQIPIDELEMGDLVFFSSVGDIPDHVGIYVGNHRFLHAEKKAGRVIVTDLNQPWYARRLLAARRVIDL
jgi:cell wall-associated NlpC family hydrolase